MVKTLLPKDITDPKTTKIKIEHEGYSAFIDVTIDYEVGGDGLKADPSSVAFSEIGQTKQLKALFNGEDVTAQSTFVSRNTNLVTVTASGLLKVVKLPSAGQTKTLKIEVKYQEQTIYIGVTVENEEAPLNHIPIFGDSITLGEATGGGWVKNLKNDCTIDDALVCDIYNCDIYNSGVNGDMSPDLLSRFRSNFTSLRIPEADDKIIIFAIGINDSVYNSNTREFNVPKETFRSNMQTLINQAKAYNPTNIILVSLTPVDEPKVNDALHRYNPYKSYKNIYIEQFNTILRSVASANNVSYVDVYTPFYPNRINLLSDGLHPNSQGYELIYDTVDIFLLAKEMLEC
ncbi:MAG: SGNH/GDSL hydrolase family protein [Candidatus Portnoybacteria bacterium]|nr:SGNH/GDSL hydrolase family protein [Candidatus Portnoybacteria bacterium]